MRNYALHYERVQLGTEPRHCPACVSCVHSAGALLVLGTQHGRLFVYSRTGSAGLQPCYRFLAAEELPLGARAPITCVQFHPSGQWVACGTARGDVVVAQCSISEQAGGSARVLMRHTVTHHRVLEHSGGGGGGINGIGCLLWSASVADPAAVTAAPSASSPAASTGQGAAPLAPLDGRGLATLFSGSQAGGVVMTAVPTRPVAGGSFFSGFSADEAQSELLLQEESPVVQMDIGGSASEPLLLLSSRLRCLILDLSLGQDSAAVQVGRKVRDGKLGACFARALGGAAAGALSGSCSKTG